MIVAIVYLAYLQSLIVLLDVGARIHFFLLFFALAHARFYVRSRPSALSPRDSATSTAATKKTLCDNLPNASRSARTAAPSRKRSGGGNRWASGKPAQRHGEDSGKPAR